MRARSMPTARLRSRVAGSTRVAALRMFVHASPGLAAAATVLCLAEMVLPNLTLITMGLVIGHIPAAVRDGFSSAAGHALTVSLILAGICFALSMLRGPVEDILSAAAQARVGADMQRRLVAAVSAPAGIAHLEDPAVLDRLASAQGELMSYRPADAPMTLISLIGSRLSGLFACAVLSTFRWWLGPLLLVTWLCVRGPLRGLVSSRVGTFRQAAEPLRRGLYHFFLAWRPAAAKEVRIFGLGEWAATEGARLYTEAMTSSWRTVWRLNRRVALSGVLVLAAYAVGVGTIGWAAYHHTAGLRTTATMLPILAATMSIGSVTALDFSLESMLSALPDLDALTRELGSGDLVGSGERAATGLPARSIRLDGLGFRYPGGDGDVLADLDLELPAGRSLAIVGVNGAGKTTLVTLLARLRDPTAGRILLDGDPLEEFDARSWQRQVAVVFQDFNRYPLSLAENISMDFSKRRAGDKPASESLRTMVDKSGATQLVAQVGWDTVLSPQYTGGVDLSGGQWQRVALARALYAVERGARLLILDEPTSQLDVRVRFQLAAGEVVGVGDLPRRSDTEAVRSAVDRADASSVIAGLTDGMATPLGRTFTGGRELSGGQWQRLALARGLMRDEPLLTVLDEPTASLDAAAESVVFERYAAASAERVACGAVTLLVSHRFSTARIADLIIVVADGRVVEVGSHGTLMTSGGVYADLFSLQARGYA